MSEPYGAGHRLQAGILSTVRKSQEITVGVLQISVQSITPILPKVNAPLVGKLPRPEDVVASTYDFAEQFLASQRKFTEEVVRVTKPLLWGGPSPGPVFDDDDEE